jgi:hypothetical protein
MPTKVKHRVYAVCAALLLCVAVFGKDAPSGFSGTWDIDKNQSTASSEIPDGLQQQIQQKKVRDGY